MVLMIEGADLQDLMIIFEQFEQDKELYTITEIKDILQCISLRRQTIESKQNIDKIRRRAGL